MLLLFYENKGKERRKSKEAQEETRFRVASYLRKKIDTQKQASEIFGITERGVNKIWSQYKQGGKRALYSSKRGVQTGKSYAPQKDRHLLYL